MRLAFAFPKRAPIRQLRYRRRAEFFQLQIRQGSQTRQFPLRAVFGQPGYYVADVVPTRAGDYVWTFSGSVGSDQVNEAFDTADGKFAPVSASDAIEFPIAAPDPEQAALQLQSAEALGQRALLVAYVGVALGVSWRGGSRGPVADASRGTVRVFCRVVTPL